jgi:hypothetical protein
MLRQSGLHGWWSKTRCLESTRVRAKRLHERTFVSSFLFVSEVSDLTRYDTVAFEIVD